MTTSSNAPRQPPEPEHRKAIFPPPPEHLPKDDQRGREEEEYLSNPSTAKEKGILDVDSMTPAAKASWWSRKFVEDLKARCEALDKECDRLRKIEVEHGRLDYARSLEIVANIVSTGMIVVGGALLESCDRGSLGFGLGWGLLLGGLLINLIPSIIPVIRKNKQP